MKNISATYSNTEKAWVSPDITEQRNFYLMIELKTPGKVVLRQKNRNGEFPMVPMKKHRNATVFHLRMQLNAPASTIRIFTSSEPKLIRYAYI